MAITGWAWGESKQLNGVMIDEWKNGELVLIGVKLGLGLEVRREKKMRKRRMKEEEKSKRRSFGERSLGGLYLFQAFGISWK